MIDTKAIEEHIRGILVALGDDPDREGLVETPKRVAKMYEEVFEGMNYTNHEIAEMFDKSFEDGASDAVVVMRDIDLFSYCASVLTERFLRSDPVPAADGQMPEG
jgi:GTP cyclohydrolase I